MSNKITLNSEQLAAIAGFKAWWSQIKEVRAKHGRSVHLAAHMRPVYVITGLAGTGKTTLAKYAVKEVGLTDVQCQPIAPTGKAASRLRQKGMWRAMTLHSFAYLCVGEHENDDTGEKEPVFIGRESVDEVPELILLDEGSMVTGYDRDVLLGFNIPILVLGDHGQLEPVKGTAAFDLEHDADAKLEDIERQGKDSNIIRGANFVRQGFILPERNYHDMKVIIGYPDPEKFKEFAGLDGSHQILCGRNNTRQSINNEVRQLLGFTAPIPQVGEKILCRFNQRTYNVWNGELFTVMSPPEMYNEEVDTGNVDQWYINVKSLDDGREIRCKFNVACFTEDQNSEEYKDALKSQGGWDYGYAITVHSSQGSEWPNVLLIDEQMSGGNKAKWRYTGITRAAERLEYYR